MKRRYKKQIERIDPYLTLSGDEWQHEKPLQQEAEKKPSIRERLEQGKKECEKQAPPHDRGKTGPEL